MKTAKINDVNYILGEKITRKVVPKFNAIKILNFEINTLQVIPNMASSILKY